jgi:hypothetical protein
MCGRPSATRALLFVVSTMIARPNNLRASQRAQTGHRTEASHAWLASPFARMPTHVVTRLVVLLVAILNLFNPHLAHAQCGVPQSCCFAHNGRGCSEPNCCQAICAFDPFCCSTQWDAQCAALAQANCGVCGVGCGSPAAGTCCAPKTTPACSNAPCCTIICAQDAFCCDGQWDQFCAATALQFCGVCADPCGEAAQDDCCVPHQAPGCNNPDCCEGLCTVDPFCCDVQWDAKCAFAAQLSCGVCGVGCGNPSAGDCCAPKPTPACDDPACCVPICAADSYCCDVEWDTTCAELAIEYCGTCSDECGSPLTGACCVAHANARCDDATCCENVCAADMFCCTTQWDATCATAARGICGVCGIGCGDAASGDCCTARTTPSCSDALCCEAICALDGFCCETEWDATCAQGAQILCGDCGGACGTPQAGSCCSARTTPGCADDRCCLSICLVDPVCCIEAWDTVCAQTASLVCGVCGPGCGEPSSGSCCVANTTPSCSNTACCSAVCVQDPFCCESQWDESCVERAIELCTACANACGAPTAGDCCTSHATPSCSNSLCCTTICAADAFCCDIQWDNACATAARAVCTSCSRPGDLNGDGNVNSADLTMLLNAWGTAAADIDGNGVTGASDLLVLLNNWT